MTNVLVTAVNFGLVEFRWDFVIMIFNVLVLFLFLRWKLFGPVTAFMQKRADKIKNTIAAADQKNTEASALKASYQEKLDNIHNEELDILKNARLAAEARTAEMIKQAERDIEQMKIKAQNEIEAERRKSVMELKDEIANLALLAASKVIDKEIDAQKHVDLIDRFIERAGDAKWQN